MSLILRCTCQQKIRIAPESRGQTVQCPHCGTRLKVPVAEASPAAPYESKMLKVPGLKKRSLPKWKPKPSVDSETKALRRWAFMIACLGLLAVGLFFLIGILVS